MADSKTKLEVIATTVQVLSVVAGVVISALSFNAARHKEAEVRQAEIEKPFQDLRRAVYLEAVKTAAVIANPDDRTPTELALAKRRFRELYVAELSMVETDEVASRMIDLAGAVDPNLTQLTQPQSAALDLAHALGASYTAASTNRKQSRLTIHCSRSASPPAEFVR